MLNALYNQVDEEVHKLVILSNKSQKHLESLMEVRKFEEQTQQVPSPSSLLRIFSSLLTMLRIEYINNCLFSDQTVVQC